MILPPYLPLFTDEFLGSVSTLTNEQLGAYVRISFAGWHHAVGDSPASIRNIVGATISEADLNTVLSWFYSDGQNLKNTRIEIMRQRYAARSVAGKSGGAASARGRALRISTGA